MNDQLHDQPSGGTHEGDQQPVEPGRGIELTPVPPGASLLVLGIVMAVLAPLGGFLAGSMVDSGGTTDEISPMYIYLFVGFVLGGLGLALAALGSLRLFRAAHAGHE